MLMIGSNEIGGGYVRMGFTDNETRLKVGTPLTAEKIKSWPTWKRLIETGHIAVYPPPPKTSNTPSNVVNVHPRPAENYVLTAAGYQQDGSSGTVLTDTAPAILPKRHVVSAGFGRFDVFEGRKLNDKALSKDEAEKLAAS